MTLQSLIWLLVTFLALGMGSDPEELPVVDEVFVYHFIVPHWGNSFAGWQKCPNLPKVAVPLGVRGSSV